MTIEEQAKKFRDNVEALTREIGKAIVGHQEVVRQVIVAILAEGHALLEGVPGIGKTLLVRTISQCLNLKFSRIQFTPDLMPADILGTNIVVEDAQVPSADSARATEHAQAHGYFSAKTVTPSQSGGGGLRRSCCTFFK